MDTAALDTRATRRLVGFPAFLNGFSAFSADAEIKPIPRLLPPQGIALKPEQLKSLESRLDGLAARMGPAPDPDVEIFHKAVRFALLHREFYKPDQVKIADKLLDEAERRLAQKPDLDKQHGVFVEMVEGPQDPRLAAITDVAAR